MWYLFVVWFLFSLIIIYNIYIINSVRNIRFVVFIFSAGFNFLFSQLGLYVILRDCVTSGGRLTTHNSHRFACVSGVFGRHFRAPQLPTHLPTSTPTYPNPKPFYPSGVDRRPHSKASLRSALLYSRGNHLYFFIQQNLRF